MLDELESVVRPNTHRSSRRGSGWVIAVALCAAATAGIWWWSQQPSANRLPSFDGIPERVPGPAAAAKLPPATPSASAVPIAATAARIEVLSEDTSARPFAQRVSAEAAESPTATRSAVAPAKVPKVPAEQEVQASARPSATSTVAGAERVAKAEPVAKVRRVAADPAQATRNRTPPPSAAGKTLDADVLLLSALLDHVSTEGQGEPLASSNQVTLAQIVRRCESRGGKSAAQVRECRRRICEGYWGKADACPARLAPRENS